MYGLPEQSVDDVLRTATLAAGLTPSRLAVFGYAHVPWFKVHQKLIDRLRSPARLNASRRRRPCARRWRRKASRRSASIISRGRRTRCAGRAHGELHRNFQGYTTDQADALIGFGVSSIGRLPQGYIGKIGDRGTGAAPSRRSVCPSSRGLAFTAGTKRAAPSSKADVDFSVDFGAIAAAHHFREDAFDDAVPHLSTLLDRGSSRSTAAASTIAPRGRPFARLAAAAFDAYLEAKAARHSVAV